MVDKRTGLQEAISKYVFDGCLLSTGGIMARVPTAAIYEIVRQKRKGIHYACQSTSDIGELLIGAGVINKLEAPYQWMSLSGSSPNYRRSTEKGLPYPLETREYSNLAMAMRFQAGAIGIPYIPTKSLIGTDVIKSNPDILEADDPFGSGKVVLLPAIEPDVAIIHAQRADKYGNTQIWGVTMSDSNIARSAKKVIVTCEEIVDDKEIRKIPNMTAIPGYIVDAVVELPFGSFPAGTPGYYWIDMPFRKEMADHARDPEKFEAWMDKYIYNLKGHSEFLKLIGKDRLDKIATLEKENFRIPNINTDEGV